MAEPGQVGTAALVLCVVLTCSCSSPSPRAIYAAIPSTTPTPARPGACYFPQAINDGVADPPLIKVDPRPQAAIAVWEPGSNAKPCRAVLTHLTHDQAVTLASDIDRAPRVASGKSSCPMGDGTSVLVYFTYGASTHAEFAAIGLTGCSEIAGPGRISRSLTAAVRHDLAPLAPPPWRKYLAS